MIFILDHLLAKMLVYEQLTARNIMEIHLHSRSFSYALLMFYEISKTLNSHNISVKVLVSWGCSMSQLKRLLSFQECLAEQ